jgi:hypothetical protein
MAESHIVARTPSVGWATIPSDCLTVCGREKSLPSRKENLQNTIPARMQGMDIILYKSPREILYAFAFPDWDRGGKQARHRNLRAVSILRPGVSHICQRLEKHTAAKRMSDQDHLLSWVQLG